MDNVIDEGNIGLLVCSVTDITANDLSANKYSISSSLIYSDVFQRKELRGT